MTVSVIQGNLFEQDVDAIAHGCNCRGVMGAGIAYIFKRRYPQMFKDYKQRVERGLFIPGDIFFYGGGGEVNWGEWQSHPSVYNLATQLNPGRNATLDAIETSLYRMEKHAKAIGIRTIAIPRIGSGIGGLPVAAIENVVREVFEDSEIHLTIVDYQ